MQSLFNLTVSSKIIRHAHPPVQKVISYAQKIERKFLLVKLIKQMEFDTVMTIYAPAGNNPMGQPWFANITCFK